MLGAERQFGVAFLQDDEIAALRPASMLSRPFGLPSICCDEGRHRVVEVKRTKEMGTTFLKVACQDKRKTVSKGFPSSLVGWWEVEFSGQIACWDLMLPAKM